MEDRIMLRAAVAQLANRTDDVLALVVREHPLEQIDAALVLLGEAVAQALTLSREMQK